MNLVSILAIFEGCRRMLSFALEAETTEWVENLKDRDLARIADYWPQLQKLELKNLSAVGWETVGN